jgi:hypothetical protein
MHVVSTGASICIKKQIKEMPRRYACGKGTLVEKHLRADDRSWLYAFQN